MTIITITLNKRKLTKKINHKTLVNIYLVFSVLVILYVYVRDPSLHSWVSICQKCLPRYHVNEYVQKY